jgi:hypothetical protein
LLLLPPSVYRSEVSKVRTEFFLIGFGRAALPEGLAAWRDWLRRSWSRVAERA